MSEHVVTYTELIRKKVTKTITLKHCPFCGGPARFTNEGSNQVGVQCAECKVRSPLRGGKDQAKLNAAEVWNRRVEA